MKVEFGFNTWFYFLRVFEKKKKKRLEGRAQDAALTQDTLALEA
jgi:hypothetical protein